MPMGALGMSVGVLSVIVWHFECGYGSSEYEYG